MSDKLRVAIIGRTGRGDYGHDADKIWADLPEVEVVAVADENKVGLATVARRLQVEKTYTDYRRMLEEVKPDIVNVAPRWLDVHAEMVLAAAERGIHVFMEKPFCRTLEEADQIVAACERTHARLVIAHLTRYSPKVHMAKQIIKEGKIGRVLEYRGRGKEDARGGAEDLWVLGTHVLDTIRFLGGDPTSCYSRVIQGERVINKSDIVVGPEGIGPIAGDAVYASYAMPGGVEASFASIRNAGGGKRFGLQIFGSAGVMEIVCGYQASVKLLPDPAWSPGRSRVQWQDVSSAGIGKPEPIKQSGNHAGNISAAKDLVAAIRENRESLGGVYEARGTTEMILAVFESQRLGKPVELPLKNRKHPLTML